MTACRYAALALAVLVVSNTNLDPVARAQTQPTATSPAATGPVEIVPRVAVVTAIVGKVRGRAGPDKPWEVLKERQELREGAEIQTVPKSRVQLTVLPDNTVIVIDRATTKAVLAELFTANGIPTSKIIAPQGGKVRSVVPPGEPANDFEIISPGNTLAVRGTEVAVFDQAPFTPQAVSITGRAVYADAKKRIAFGGTGAGRANVRADQPTAAHVAVLQSVVDPSIPRARTASESELIQDLVARGATTFFDPLRGIDVVQGGEVPPIENLMSSLPGLNIVLSWPGNSNLDLSVAVQNQGEFLYPFAGLNRYPSGSRIPFDHRGGKAGGFEIASFPSLPSGTTQVYFLGATLISGEPTSATFQAFQDNQPLQLTVDFESFSPKITQGVTSTSGGVALLPLGFVALPEPQPLPPTEHTPPTATTPPTEPPTGPNSPPILIQKLNSHTAVLSQKFNDPRLLQMGPRPAERRK